MAVDNGDIEHGYNFNDPLVLTEVFRIRTTSVDEEGKIIEDNAEYAARTLVTWEDVKLISQYVYPDDWKKYKGEKYHIYLHGADSKLILGSFKDMETYWTMFRNAYPLFPIGDGLDKD